MSSSYLEIEKRAAAVDLNMGSLCKEAGIAPSTLWRWKTGKTDPLRTYRSIETVLQRYEQAQ